MIRAGAVYAFLAKPRADFRSEPHLKSGRYDGVA